MDSETMLIEQGTDYFFAVYELHPLRLTVVLLSLCLTVVLVPLLATIIWQDWNNPGPNRIFTNRIVSSLLMNVIGYLILAVLPDILRYLIGPFSESFCYFHYIIKNIFALHQLLLTDALFLARYFFIFWMKNPSAFEDKFWIYFTNMAATIFCFLTQFSFALMPGRQPIIYYFCSGKNPDQDQPLIKKVNIIMILFQVGSLACVTFVILKIQIFKRKGKHQPPSSIKKESTWDKVFKSLIFNASMLFLIAEIAFVVNKINFLTPADLNIFPNSMYVNIFQIINPIVICGVLPLIYIWKNTNMNIFNNGILQRHYTCKI